MASSAHVPVGWWYLVPTNYTASNIGASKFAVIIGDKSTARRTFLADMITAGFVGLSLHYVVQCQIQDSGASGWPYSNQWAYDSGDWATINANESWFLHCGTPATSSNRIYSSSHWWYMDPGSAGWRTWVATRAAAMKTAGYFDYDGLFLDNVPLTWNKELAAAQAQGDTLRNGSGTAYTEATYLTAELGFLSAVRTAIGTDQLWGNLIRGNDTGSEWNNSMAYLDGGMHEGAIGWDTSYLSTSRMNGVLTQLEWCASNSKGYIFTGLGSETDYQKRLFAMCMYYLIRPANNTPTSTPISCFRWTKTTRYNYWEQFAELTAGLGEPSGARQARSDGITGWTRAFANGTVRVDQIAHTGEILPPSTDPLVATAVSTNMITQLAVNVPTGVVNGDFMIMHASSREDNQSITTPTGWILADTDIQTATTPDTCGYIFTRVASSEPASYTVTQSVSGCMALSIIAIRGVDGIDIRGKNKSVAAVTDFPITGVTTEYDDDYVLAIATIHGASTGVTKDTSTTELVNIQATVNTTNDVSAHAAYFRQANAGATGDKTITIATARYAIGFMVSLRLTPETPPGPVGGNANLSRVVIMRDSENNIINNDAPLEEVLFSYGVDGKRIGLYTDGQWKWPGWHYLNNPLISASFDGDSFSDTTATLIDLSTLFNAPEGIRAVYLYVLARDSDSVNTECSIGFSPDLTNVQTKRIGTAADVYDSFTPTVPCNSDGNIYYTVNASGTGTLDLIIRIYGYCF